MTDTIAAPTAFLTPAQTAEKYPCFTEAALRWHLFRRAQNGLDSATIRVGRKLLIDEAKFVAWLRDHAEVGRQELA